MDTITNTLKLANRAPRSTRGAPPDRGELLKEFCERINNACKGAKYPPVSIGRMAKLVQGMSTQWLHYLGDVLLARRSERQ
jgi:hypothetical protein